MRTEENVLLNRVVLEPSALRDVGHKGRNDPVLGVRSERESGHGVGSGSRADELKES
jgi:hypothetical protein